MSPLSLRRCVIAAPAPLAAAGRAALAGRSVPMREQPAAHCGARTASAAIGAGDEFIGEQ